ncbi:MAG: hypothetical protein NZ528_15615 [Caldilineales bacterium]|nr:hypothetical protein [Caldilineales bacterium]MDW8316371.1 hypothetical protein [Anaerolineae bacterium]
MASTNGTSDVVASAELLEDELITELTDEAYEELASLEGSLVVGVSFWDSSLADDLEEGEIAPEERMLLDLDIYLENNVTLELYGVALYTSLEDPEPVVGMENLEQALVAMVDRESILDEVAESEDGALVLVFSAGGEITLLASVSAWTISEWDELPSEAD